MVRLTLPNTAVVWMWTVFLQLINSEGHHYLCHNYSERHPSFVIRRFRLALSPQVSTGQLGSSLVLVLSGV